MRHRPAWLRPAWARTSAARHRAPGRSRLYVGTRAVVRAVVWLAVGAFLPAYLVFASWLVSVWR